LRTVASRLSILSLAGLLAACGQKDPSGSGGQGRDGSPDEGRDAADMSTSQGTGGISETGGTSAGTGGASAGTLGTNAGTDAAGTGGASAGTLGTNAGTGGSGGAGSPGQGGSTGTSQTGGSGMADSGASTGGRAGDGGVDRDADGSADRATGGAGGGGSGGSADSGSVAEIGGAAGIGTGGLGPGGAVGHVGGAGQAGGAGSGGLGYGGSLRATGGSSTGGTDDGGTDDGGTAAGEGGSSDSGEGGAGGEVSGSDDHGNGPATATTIAAGAPAMPGVLETDGDQDWFAFAARSGHIYFVTGTEISVGVSLLLYGPDGITLLSTEDSASFTFEIAAAGTHYLVVQAKPRHATGSYSVGIADLGLDDHGDNAASATPITPDGMPTQGTLETAGDQDWFALTVVPEHRYEIAATEDVVDLYLFLYDSDGSTILWSGDIATLSYEFPTAGTCYVAIKSKSSGARGSYAITVTDLGI
jgi:hypothetical protein